MTRTSSCCVWKRSSRSPRPGGRVTARAVANQRELAWICRKAWAVFASLILLLAGFVGPLQAAEPVAYTLGAGDRIKVTIFDNEDLSGSFTIDGTGLISLPLIGKIKAGGMTVHETEKTIIAKLKPDYLKNPRVAVEVLNYRPFYIIGEVKSPGSYPYVSGMKAVNAIALGGGYTYRARENNIYITRAKDPKRQKQKASHETIVMPGDVIEVPERYF